MIAALWWSLIRFGFRLLYNEMAWTYDVVSATVSLGEWKEWQKTALAFLGDERFVLELAHGTGNLQVELDRDGQSVVGIDISHHMGRIARNKLMRNRIKPKLIRGSALALPFRPLAFSAVITTFPTEFFLRPGTLDEVMRVLAPGGQFIIVPLGILKLSGLAPRFLEWLYEITGQRGPWPGDVLAPFVHAGCEVAISEVERKQSIVTVIVAKKPA